MGAADTVTGAGSTISAAIDPITLAANDARLAVSSIGAAGLADGGLVGELGALNGDLAGIVGAADDAKAALTDLGAAGLSDSALTGDLTGINTDLADISTNADAATGAITDLGKLGLADAGLMDGLSGIVGETDKITASAREARAALIDMSKTPQIAALGGVAGGGKGEKTPGEKKGSSGGVGFLGLPATKEEWRAWSSEASKALGEAKSKLKDLVSGSAMAGVGTLMLPTAMSSAGEWIDQLAGFSKMTGLPMASAWQAMALGQGAGLQGSQLSRIVGRFEKNVLGGTGLLQGVQGQAIIGQAENIGLGRQAINPATLTLGGPTETMARLFALAGVNPGELSKMNFLQQLQAVAGGLGTARKHGLSETQETAVIQQLFGTGKGTNATALQLLIRDLPSYEKILKQTPNPITALGLPANATEAAAGARMSAYALSSSFMVLLVQLLPVMQEFTKALLAFTMLIEHPTSGKSVDAIAGALNPAHPSNLVNDILAILAGKKLVGAGKSLVGAAGKLVPKGVGEAIGTTGLELAGTGAEIVSRLLGPAGIAAAVLANPDALAPGTSGKGANAWDAMWQHFVAPHASQTKFSSRDVETAITEAAKVFGLNSKAMLSDSYAEASLNPGAYNKTSGAGGIFQFIPSTWASDTKKFLGQSLPQRYASNPYIAAFIAAAAMRSGGIGTQKDSQVALADMIHGFENPGKAGEKGDLSRGLPFLQALEGALDRATASTKTKAPQLTKTIDAELLKIVSAAKTRGATFDAETEKYLHQAETYLKAGKDPFSKAGEDLMKGLVIGLENERGSVMREARSIANEITATLQKALKTHSPSALTMEIGANVAQGLALGIDNTTHAVQQAAGRLAGAAVPMPASGPGGGYGGNLTVYVTLTGAVGTPRQIAQQLRDAIHDEMYHRTKLVANFE